MLLLKPMLAESLDNVDRLPKYAADDRYVFEQKVDGIRIMVHVEDGRVTPRNRKGEPTGKDVPNKVLNEFKRLVNGRGAWYFDGELVDGVLWLFDLPAAGEIITPDTPYLFRRNTLGEFLTGWNPPDCIRALPMHSTTEDKLTLAKTMVERGAEGVMVKDGDAPYLSGKRTRHVLKAKFVKDGDCVVMATQVGGKDSMTIGMFPDDWTMQIRTAAVANIRQGTLARDIARRIEVGRCTMLAGDKDKIQPGDVVCVKYLYAVDPRAPRLYQPTYPIIRTDKSPEECVQSQIQFTDKSVLA